MARVVAIAVIIYSYFEIRNAVPQLPARSSAFEPGLQITLMVQIVVTFVFFAIPWVASSFPEVVHFGWRCLTDYTWKQRERIMPLVKQMAGVMSLVVSLLFAIDIHQQIRAATSAAHRLPVLWFVVGMPLGLGVIAIHYVLRMDEVAGKE